MAKDIKIFVEKYRYRRKSNEIIAVRYSDTTAETICEVANFVKFWEHRDVVFNPKDNTIKIPAFKGDDAVASAGDYIIAGYKGECWVLTSKIFEESFEKVENISDGYHTFKEYFEYRTLYNAAFFNELCKHKVCNVVKSKRHSGGEECFNGGWFIVTAQLPTGQVSNHYELKDWDLFDIPEVETAPEWDGHTPQEAAERIKRYIIKDY